MTASPPPGNAAARLILWLGLALGVWLIGALFIDRFTELRLGTAYCLPPLLALLCAAAGWLAWLGSSRVPWPAFAAGTLFVAGGAAFDVFATLWHSPDLAQEENPIARVLLDSGHPVRQVYAYGAVYQVLIVALVCLLWLGLLRHWAALVDSVRGHRGLFDFLKAASGGAELSYRQWLLPLRAAEFPWAFHLAWLLAATLLGGSAYRWHLGLEWFGVVPHGWRQVVLWTSVSVGCVAYLAWLWRAASR
jgi:hypothetical protein